MEYPKDNSRLHSNAWILIDEAFLDRLLNDVQPSRRLDRCPPRRPLGMQLQYGLEVGSHVRTNLNGLLLRVRPQKWQDEPWSCGRMGKNGRYGRLGLLCNEFLREATHLEEVGQNNLDQRVKASAHGSGELQVQ